jgi:hypothetical protein
MQGRIEPNFLQDKMFEGKIFKKVATAITTIKPNGGVP